MPFNPVFDDVWQGAIKRACAMENFACLRVDEIRLSSWITKDIESNIEIADVVIADITKSNPNVMFELGWALAKNKAPIVIRQKDDSIDVPFDVKGIRHLPYLNTWSGIEKLYREICKFIKTTTEQIVEKKQEKKKS
jgi:nucleoside 2-deoxyribosyltransferase